MRIGIGADHGGFQMKEQLAKRLAEQGHEVIDFGNMAFDPDDDYPDFAIPLARAVAGGDVERGILLCGSGVGASVAANKVSGARAALCHDDYSARQGVEDDDLNILVLRRADDGNRRGLGLHQEFPRAPDSARRRATGAVSKR